MMLPRRWPTRALALAPVVACVMALVVAFLAGLTPAAAAPSPPTLGTRTRGEVHELTIRWTRPVAAAAFVRAGRLWLLFERATDLPPPALPPAEDAVFGGLVLHPHPELLVLSLEAPAVALRLTRRKSTWTLALGGTAAPPEAVLEPAGPEGGLRIAGGGRVVAFDDPVVGDRLGVALLAGSARGEAGGRRLPLVEVLASLQGVVWKPRADGWSVAATGDDIVFPAELAAGGLAAAPAGTSTGLTGVPSEVPTEAAEARAGLAAAPTGPAEPAEAPDRPAEPPVGLAGPVEAPIEVSGEPTGPLTGPPDAAAGQPAHPVEPPAQDAAATAADRRADQPPALLAELPAALVAREPSAAGAGAAARPAGPPLALTGSAPPEGVALRDHRRGLEQRLAAARGADRLDARLALVRTLVAHELAAEALAALAPLRGQSDDPALDALAGAAALLAGRPEEASRELGRPALDSDPEVQLWRAVAAARRGDWPAARQHAERGVAVPDYPPGLRFRLGLELARIDLAAGRTDAALATLDRLKALQPGAALTAELRLIEAEALARQGDAAAAEAARRQAAAEGSVLVTVAAAHAQTMAAFDSGGLAATEALERLEAVRSGWRGHPDEVQMMTDLGRVALAAGEAPAAIGSWREASRRADQTGRPHAGDAARRLAAAHLLAAIGGDAATTPLEALLLLRQNEAELKAEAAARAEIERRLAHRLAEAGFDRPAAELLGRRIDLAGSGEERAAAGAAIAHGRLAEGRYAQAASILELSGPEDLLPGELRAERARLQALAAARAAPGPIPPPGLVADRSPAAIRARLGLAILGGDWAAAEIAAGALLAAADADASANAATGLWAAANVGAGDRAGDAAAAGGWEDVGREGGGNGADADSATGGAARGERDDRDEGSTQAVDADPAGRSDGRRVDAAAVGGATEGAGSGTAAGMAALAGLDPEQALIALALAQARLGRDTELARTLGRSGDGRDAISAPGQALLAMLRSPVTALPDLAATAAGLEAVRTYLAGRTSGAS